MFERQKKHSILTIKLQEFANLDYITVPKYVQRRIPTGGSTVPVVTVSSWTMMA